MVDVQASIIIPAYNEAENIGKCIASILKNTDVQHEIIVVDNGSKDATAEIAKVMGVTVLSKPKATISALRNSGARCAKGELLVFLDADMVVPEDFINKGKKYFDSGFMGALGFAIIVPSDSGWVARTWGQPLNSKRERKVEVDFLGGSNIFIKKIVFEEVGGFDELLNTNEDKDFTMRVAKAGYSLITSYEINVIHLGYERDLSEFIRKEFWRQGSTLMFARHWRFAPSTLRNPLLSLWHVGFFLLFISSLLLYARAGTFLYSLVTLALWLLPALLIALKKAGRNIEYFGLGWFFSFFLLTFIRWNVSGVSLLVQIVKLFRFRSHNV
ncbi:MAG: glycosyltransferase [Nitrospirae bacterium]|nr:glycosyltransferase [Nitrospirota bacterium]